MTENHTKSNDDSIDLIELLARILIAFKNNLSLILSTTLIGALLGYGYFQFEPKKYESKMLISSDILTESYSKSLIFDLSLLIKEGNIPLISEKLQLTENQAAALTYIEIKSSIEKSDQVKEGEKIFLSVTCRAKDNEIWPSLQAGFLTFLESTDYVKIRVEQRKKYINQVIEKIDSELSDLSQLKIKIANGTITQSGKDNVVVFDPTTVNSKILELNKEKITLQNSMETVKSVQLVSGFNKFIKPVSPKLSSSIAIGSFIGFFCAILIVALKYLSKFIHQAQRKIAES
jgi:LPS O-antigen subunit length determinant protein (WzzB/FepE family)